MTSAVAARSPHRPYPASDLLRFATAGSVDDGKSTLIGRLLHDSKGIADDQLQALHLASRRRGVEGLDLSLLTDGLRAEREQGITIDVAYRYFATPRRKFIVADTPGHVQYTRNMATGCSTADLAVVLVDARAGVVEQTRRHLVIAALLRVPRVVAAVNKMDLVGYDKAVFQRIVADLRGIAGDLRIRPPDAIPVSALRGDNVVEGSSEMPWYEGSPLLEYLETVDTGADEDGGALRLPVQWVVRDHRIGGSDYRGYAGRVEGGMLREGDPVVALPSGILTRVASVDTFDGPVPVACRGQSVVVRLEDDVDLGRGGMLAGAGDVPPARNQLQAAVCWLDEAPLTPGRRYTLLHTTLAVRAIATSIDDRLDINSLERLPASSLGVNEVGHVRFALSAPIYADRYLANRTTGSAILVDESSNATVGAVLIVEDGERWP